MARKAVIFCTDGIRDFVVTPDGVKYMLGPHSVLQLVAKLVPRTQAHRVLDEFNSSGEAMTVLDLDALFEMLAPPRRRLLARTLIPALNRVPTKGASTMSADSEKALKDAIANQISMIERQIGVLQQKVKDSGGTPAESMKSDLDSLKDLIGWLKRPSAYGDQSKNDAFDGLKAETPAGAKAASFDTLTENSNTAETILTQVGEASQMVTKLASQGRRFNATKALADLHAISTRVAEILQDVDLAQSWVRNDLNDLAHKAAHIHGLFLGAK